MKASPVTGTPVGRGPPDPPAVLHRAPEQPAVPPGRGLHLGGELLELLAGGLVGEQVQQPEQ
ncbi:MAG: hypothetical protein L0H64_10745 [Pseudonocardia sp.]|nr:hypothetical protein [Pseudonocardia sp.]